MIRFFIQEQEVDLFKDASIAVTKQINDVGSVGATKGNLSNDFKIPKTKNNQRILERSDQVQGLSDKPYRKLPCRTIHNGVGSMDTAFCVVENSDEDFYKVTAYSGNVDLPDRLGDKLISSLDLSPLDHTFDFATVTGSFANDYTDGYKYPLIDYGTLSNANRNVDVRFLRPAPFNKYILQQILDEAGYDGYEGTLFSNAMFEKEIMPCVKNELSLSEDDVDSLLFSVRHNGDINGTYPLTFFSTGSHSGHHRGSALYNPFPLDDAVFDNGANWQTGIYHGTIRLASQQRWTFEVDVDTSILTPPTGTTFTQGTSNFSIVVYKNGVFAGGTLIPYGNTSHIGTLTLTTPWINCSVGDVITVSFEIVSDISFLDASLQPITAYDGVYQFELSHAEFSNEVNPSITYGSPITFSNTLAEIKQIDFISSVFRRYAVVMDIDQYRNVIILNCFNDIVSNKPLSEDWSGKLDEQKPAVNYRIEGYAQRNTLTYKEDSNDEDIAKQTGDGEILVDDQTLELSSRIHEQIYAPTFMWKRLQDLDLAKIKIVPDAGTVFSLKVENRILLDDTQVITGGDISFTDTLGGTLDTSNDIPLCYFILAGKTMNLGFNNSLITDNYPSLIGCLDKTKFIVRNFKLTDRDFYNINHFIPVFIRSLGNYFYINKVINFKGEGLTQCELIRL